LFLIGNNETHSITTEGDPEMSNGGRGMKLEGASRTIAIALAAGLTASIMPAAVQGQTAPADQPPAQTETPAPAQPAEPAPPAAAEPAAKSQLPQVEVIQKQPPKVKKKAVARKKKVPAKKAPPPSQPPPAEAVQAVPGPSDADIADIAASAPLAGPAEPTEVRMTPFGNSGIPIAKVPSGVTTLSSGDIERDGAVIPQDVLNQRVPGVVIGDYQGNAFQTNVQYRGFDSSPVNGVPQGLAVYQEGVRINEAFGDIVNWDFLPTNAISGITVMSGNPVFGLNALGGSISIDMKDGFNYHGGEVDTRFGSFGRKQVAVQAGMQSGAVAAYIAAEGIDDDGFRDFSDAEVRRMYADLGFKGERSEFHLNFTGGDNHVGVTAAAPEVLLDDRGWDRTFTSPQTTDNDLAMVSLNGTVQATDTLSISGVTYFRKFKQKHDDGNIAEAEECDENPGLLCIEDGVAFGRGPGVNPDGTIPFDDDVNYGTIDRTSQDAESWGLALQATDKSHLFGFRNQFTIGTSYDHGRVKYGANSELGTFLPRFVVAGTGIQFQAPPDPLPPGIDCDDPEECASDDIIPRSLTTTNDYFGLYFTNTTDLTDRLALTVGGRYNYARIKLHDNTGDFEDLNGSHTYERFNPTIGATYKLAPGLSLYGGYSEANRAPTAAELSCADPENPCLIESFLTADPPLDQVVSHTFELGLRGEKKLGWAGDKIDWGLGVFRTLNTDDIISVAAPENGRGFFLNAGDTLRQGVEANISYTSRRLFTYASYAFIDATYRDSLTLSSPDNPFPHPCPIEDPDEADEDANCVDVTSGDRLPGVPRHRFKAGFDYWITPEWKFGADFIAVSSQFFFGDEANLDRPLPGYTKVNLHTSYDINDHIQIYGLIENLFDNHYGIYGTYYNTELAEVGGAADTPPSNELFENDSSHRSITPAIPFAAYGGVKIRF
jgi:iron complex outermembrane receptor protein